jgi:outer membrane protein OmpA-like peptidoglycan-associated protein
MIRSSAGVLALGLLSGLAPAPFHASLAADNQTTSQIIDALTPGSGTMVTRGIRPGGGGGTPAAARPATPASTGGAPVPQHPAEAPRASLSVPFATGSATLSAGAEQVLDRLAAALASTGLAESKFRVEGHTDTVGQPDANKTLSERRAETVLDYLSQHGIDRARLTAVGMGQDDLLVATGPNVPDGRNRRVVVVNEGH